MTLHIPVLFDLDGVLVDNVDFERAVTSHIIQQLATERGIAEPDAEVIWKTTLEAHRHHARWHDYSYHCQSLNLGDFWRKAHRSSSHLLKKFSGTDDAIEAARKIGPVWLVSDATRWVVEFKLAISEIEQDYFSEIFTVDRCKTNKGEPDYWKVVKEKMLPERNAGPIYIDNREDRLRVARGVLPEMVGVCVDADDHPVSLGFGELNSGRVFAHSTHESLHSVLEVVHQRVATEDSTA